MFSGFDTRLQKIFLDIIDKKIGTAISNSQFVKMYSGIVTSVNADGTINVNLRLLDENGTSSIATNIPNKSASALTVGDNVMLIAYNNDISNLFIFDKLTGNNIGYTDAQAISAVGSVVGNTTSINLTYTASPAGIKAYANFGTSAGTIAQGNHTHPESVITFTDITTKNASTSSHGYAPKAVAPASGINILGIANGETVFSNKLLNDANLLFTDVTTKNASTSMHGFAPKAVAPASGLINFLGIANGETVYANKALFDATVPSTQAFGDSASVGTASVAARRDHKHAMPATPTASSVGLGNVTNNAQVKKIVSSVDDEIMTWNGATGDTPKSSGTKISGLGQNNIIVENTLSTSGTTLYSDNISLADGDCLEIEFYALSNVNNVEANILLAFNNETPNSTNYRGWFFYGATPTSYTAAPAVGSAYSSTVPTIGKVRVTMINGYAHFSGECNRGRSTDYHGFFNWNRVAQGDITSIQITAGANIASGAFVRIRKTTNSLAM